MEKIGVIVPAYNTEKYIHKCINSILNQTVSNFELVIVDDGSTDGTPDICDFYQKNDERVHVIHKPNGGLSDARNAGLEWVVGHDEAVWIAFIDSDDYVTEDYLEKLYTLAKQYNTKCSICGCKRIHEVSYVNDEPLMQMDSGEECIITPEDAYGMYADNAGGVYFITAWGKLFHKDLLIDIRFPYGRINEDEFVIYKVIFQCDRIAMTSEHMYQYVQRNDGIMKSEWTPLKMDVLDAFIEQLSYFKGNSYDKAYIKALGAYLDTLNAQIEDISKIHNDESNHKYELEMKHRIRCALKIKKTLGITLKENIRWRRNTFPIRYSKLWWHLKNKRHQLKKIQ